MRKKQYIHPECSCDEISFSLLQSSGTNIYDNVTESGLIRTNATVLDASWAEVKSSDNGRWNIWE